MGVCVGGGGGSGEVPGRKLEFTTGAGGRQLQTQSMGRGEGPEVRVCQHAQETAGSPISVFEMWLIARASSQLFLRILLFLCI